MNFVDYEVNRTVTTDFLSPYPGFAVLGYKIRCRFCDKRHWEGEGKFEKENHSVGLKCPN